MISLFELWSNFVSGSLVAITVVAVLSFVDSRLKRERRNVMNGNKVSSKTDGEVQGMWSESDKGTLCLITENPRSPAPYIGLYLKSEDGHQQQNCHAMHFEGNDVILQIPDETGKTVRMVKMSAVRKLIEAASELSK